MKYVIIVLKKNMKRCNTLLRKDSYIVEPHTLNTHTHTNAHMLLLFTQGAITL